ncbi:hypothetical protein GCM10010471_12930 [Leucobacter komagatae]
MRETLLHRFHSKHPGHSRGRLQGCYFQKAGQVCGSGAVTVRKDGVAVDDVLNERRLPGDRVLGSATS